MSEIGGIKRRMRRCEELYLLTDADDTSKEAAARGTDEKERDSLRECQGTSRLEHDSERGLPPSGGGRPRRGPPRCRYSLWPLRFRLVRFPDWIPVSSCAGPPLHSVSLQHWSLSPRLGLCSLQTMPVSQRSPPSRGGSVAPSVTPTLSPCTTSLTAPAACLCPRLARVSSAA